MSQLYIPLIQIGPLCDFSLAQLVAVGVGPCEIIQFMEELAHQILNDLVSLFGCDLLPQSNRILVRMLYLHTLGV